MAEPRRISLISSALPVVEPKTLPASSSDVEAVSFTAVSFSVVAPSDNTGPCYDFAKLLAERKKAENVDVPKNDDPFGEEEEEEARAVKLAKHFEEKYGTKGPRDMKELGAGYDQNDPFVDDAQSAEAVIPPGWTTQHGGFYISTGPLYIRPLREEEEKEHVFHSATLEECFNAVKSLNALNVLSLKRKRIVEESSEDDSEPSSRDDVIQRKKMKTTKVNGSGGRDGGRDGGASGGGGDGLVKKSLPKTVASMLAERADPFKTSDEETISDVEEMPTDLRKQKTETNQNVSATKTTIRKTAIQESGRIEGAEGGPVPPIPEEVPETLRNVIDDLKKLATTWDGGKCNFFSPEHNPVINNLLLKLEYECRQFRCGMRSAVFGHVAGHLPCTKETLVKRARKLRQDDVDAKFNELITRLAHVIDNDATGGVDPTSKALKPNVKKLMVEGVRFKMAVYDLHKQRFATHEDYIRHFVDSDLTPLWSKSNQKVPKENIYCEALLALGQVFRPSPHLSKTMSGTGSSTEDFDMPPAIPAPLVDLTRDPTREPRDPTREPTREPTRDPTKSSRHTLPGRAPVASDILSVARLNSSRRDGLKQPSTSGSVRRPTAEHPSRPGLIDGKPPVFLPDVRSSAPSSKSQREHSQASRSLLAAVKPSGSSKHSIERPVSRPADRPVSGSADRPVSQPVDRSVSGPLDRSVSRPENRPVGSVRDKSHRSESAAGYEESGSRRSSSSSHVSSSQKATDSRRTASSPKVLLAHPVSGSDRPSSNSSAGSSKQGKNGAGSSGGRHRRGNDFDQNNNFSVSSLAAPFVSPYSMPLMAGFSLDNLHLGTLGASGPYSMGMFADSVAATFFSPGGAAYSAAGGTGGYQRSSGGSSSSKASPSTQNDSSFTPR